MQSHVVRAPLARIMGLINVLDHYHEMNMSQPEYFGHITRSAHELDAIIKDIVAKSSAISLEVEVSPEEAPRSEAGKSPAVGNKSLVF
jgi:hypothetical protein